MGSNALGRRGNRRTTERVDLAEGDVVCQCSGHGECYQVKNLSTAGAKLQGFPIPPVGARVRVVFLARLGMVSLAARIARHESAWCSTFGIEFIEWDEDKRLMLEDMVGRAHADYHALAHHLED